MAWVTPGTWVTGDLLTAARLNQDLRDNPLWLKENALQKIAEQVLSSSVNKVTFSSVPATFRNLQLHWEAETSASDFFSLQFNNDTGANYDGSYSEHAADATSSGGGGMATANSRMGILRTFTYRAAGFAEIFDYARTNYWKLSRAMYASVGNHSVANDIRVGHGICGWRSTAVINAVAIKLETAATFNAGSVFTLYGVP